MKRRHSLEFGRKGPEGITKEGIDERGYEPDEDKNTISDKLIADAEEIRKLLDEIEEDDIEDKLRSQTKTYDEITSEDIDELAKEEKNEIDIEEEKKKLLDSIDEIFG